MSSPTVTRRRFAAGVAALVAYAGVRAVAPPGVQGSYAMVAVAEGATKVQVPLTISEWDGRRVTLWVDAEKAEPLQAISDLCDQVAAREGWPTAIAMLEALEEGVESGSLTAGMSLDEGGAWLRARIEAKLAERRA